MELSGSDHLSRFLNALTRCHNLLREERYEALEAPDARHICPRRTRRGYTSLIDDVLDFARDGSEAG
jgi:hypothetical protein